MSQPDVSIIIINFRTLSESSTCLESIFASTDSLNKEVIVIDNASNDGSIEKLQSAYPKIKTIINKTNVGFGQANNLGAQQATGKYLLFLNSDTILDGNSLQLFLDEVIAKEIVVGSCMLKNPDGSIQPQGGSLPNIVSLLLWATGIDDLPFVNSFLISYQHRNLEFFKSNHTIGWIGGTAFLIHSETFAALNGFDPKIFMYGEDVELCIRLNKAGYSIEYLAKPQITHIGQASSSSKNSLLGEFTGLKYIFSKHSGFLSKKILISILKLAALVRIIIFGIVGNRERKKVYEEIFSMV